MIIIIIIMEYQKIINLLDDTTNQPSKFRTRRWVEINNESNGWINARFKTFIIKSNLCDYRDAYTIVKGSIIIPNTAATGSEVNITNKKVLKLCSFYWFYCWN